MKDGLFRVEVTTLVSRRTELSENYASLAAAVVSQACRDYEAIIVGLFFQKDPKKRFTLIRLKEEIEFFFTSPWYEMLTDIDGKKLIQRIREIARQTIRERIRKQHRKVLEDMKKGK